MKGETRFFLPTDKVRIIRLAQGTGSQLLIIARGGGVLATVFGGLFGFSGCFVSAQ